MTKSVGRVLDGEVAIVTGAGQGIGRAIAISLAEAGALVSVVDLNPVTAKAVADELGDHGAPGLALECDVTKRDDVVRVVAQTVAERGGLDILVNNAHDLRDVEKPFMDTDEEHLLRNLHSGFFGTYYFLQASYPHLKERRGKVVNIGSGAGVQGTKGFFSYGATKEAIRLTTRVVAREWGPDGINVNTICPSAWDTPAMERWTSTLNDEQREFFDTAFPIGRSGTAADTGGVAVFLVSAAADHITGHTIMVDGGISIDAGR